MSTQVKKQHRMLKISILRYNPAAPASVPHMQTFECEEAASMTLFILLNELRDHRLFSSTSCAVPVFAAAARC